MARSIDLIIGTKKSIFAFVIFTAAISAHGTQSRSPVFLGIISSGADNSTRLYSTLPTIPNKSQAVFFSEIDGYACCFNIKGGATTLQSKNIREWTGKPISAYLLSQSKSASKKLPYTPILGVALKRGTHVKVIDANNFLVTYGSRKAKLRICTSIESVHFYFQEDGVEAPNAHLSFALDYAVDPTCIE